MGHPLLELKDKTAVVIGGTSGMVWRSRVASRSLGANVVPTGRRAENVQSAAAEVQSLGRRTLVSTCDITDKESLESLLKSVAAEFGSIQILVNCAGRTKRAPSLEFADDDWEAILETNLTGTFNACRVFARHMVERRYGRIINIGSLSSFVGLHEVAAYCASKGAVASLTKALAVEWAKLRSVRQRFGAWSLSHRPQRETPRRNRTRPRISSPNSDAAVRTTRQTCRSRRVPGIGRRELRHRTSARGRRRFSG